MVIVVVQSMFQQVPNKHPYNKDPTGQVARIKDADVCVQDSCLCLCLPCMMHFS
jgi:hypothetical protein